MIFEEVNIFRHLIDFSFDFLKLRLETLEVTLKMENLLRTLLLFTTLTATFALLEHNLLLSHNNVFNTTIVQILMHVCIFESLA